MKIAMLNDGLDFNGLLGFEQIDICAGAARDAIAETFNKIGETRLNSEREAPSLDVSGLLGFEHLDEGTTISSESIADAFNKIGEIRG